MTKKALIESMTRLGYRSISITFAWWEGNEKIYKISFLFPHATHWFYTRGTLKELYNKYGISKKIKEENS